MEIPTLPKGYFFRLIEGSSYYDTWDHMAHETNAVIQIRKRTWFGFSSEKVLGVNIPNTHNVHVTKAQLHENMLFAIEEWERRKSTNAAYGDYPPNKL
jgi:hypothetical protein